MADIGEEPNVEPIYIEPIPETAPVPVTPVKEPEPAR